jgi:hypothetical protein
MPDETANISLQVPEEINAWLEDEAGRQLTNKSALIRGMILKERKRLKQEEQDANKATASRNR